MNWGAFAAVVLVRLLVVAVSVAARESSSVCAQAGHSQAARGGSCGPLTALSITRRAWHYLARASRISGNIGESAGTSKS